MSGLLIKGAVLYGEGEPVDVFVDEGEIRQIGTDLGVVDAEIVEARGQVLLPGFVDLHTHLREPGREDTETIETGSAAAALGGYTAVLGMENTNPLGDKVVLNDQVGRGGQEGGRGA
ncbi:amidohydrolase family protein, partial [Nocardia farcinica]|uniref:amidohydrolase family protein n=1 Tax=Nocardia farcinica TaxID=37329 RepID=UPI002455B5E9